MEYRLSLTPRLMALGFFACVALLVLVFALGFQVGQGMADRGDAHLASTAAAEAGLQGARQLERHADADRVRETTAVPSAKPASGEAP
jgi:hypothetical protein